MVKQLKKLPTQISTVSLLQSLQEHRKCSVENFEGTPCPTTISKEDLDYIAGKFPYEYMVHSLKNTPEGTRHMKSLYIVVECLGMITTEVLSTMGQP